MAGTNSEGGEGQDPWIREAFEHMWSQFSEGLRAMTEKVTNLQDELKAAKEEIRSLKENPTQYQTGTIPQGDGNGPVEGMDAIRPSFADLLKRNPEARSAVRAVAMEVASSQEAARCTSQLIERKRAVVVKGIREQTGMSPAERRDKDKKAINEILKGVKMERADQHIEKVFRLGQYNKDRDRMLKVVFTSERTKEDLLERKSGLVNVPQLKKVFLQRDMTKDERKRAAATRMERREKERNQGTTTLTPTITEESGEPSTSSSTAPRRGSLPPPPIQYTFSLPQPRSLIHS